MAVAGARGDAVRARADAVRAMAIAVRAMVGARATIEFWGGDAPIWRYGAICAALCALSGGVAALHARIHAAPPLFAARMTIAQRRVRMGKKPIARAPKKSPRIQSFPSSPCFM